jgi:RNA polymerase sigma-70 factor (ECF subfamily)
MNSSPRREKADDVLNVQNIEREAREALVRGDRRAVVKILMRGYGDRIHRYCRNLLADANDAGEASQQVFMLAFEYMYTFEGMKHFLPWLRGIATRHCAAVLRSNDDRNGLFVVGNHLPEDADPRPSGEEVLTSQWLISEVELCLDELPSQDRLMLTLRFIEELTYVDMAELVEMPVSTVKLRMRSAMRALKRSLSAKGICP